MKRILLSVACLAAGVSQAQVKWDLPTGYAANTFQTQNNQQFAKEVDELTGGKLKITLHPGGSLYKANEIKRAVQTGQVPAAEFILSGAANENALYGVDSVPFLASSYADAWRLYQVARGHALPPTQRAAPAGAADLRASTGGTQAPTVVAKLAS